LNTHKIIKQEAICKVSKPLEVVESRTEPLEPLEPLESLEPLEPLEPLIAKSPVQEARQASKSLVMVQSHNESITTPIQDATYKVSRSFTALETLHRPLTTQPTMECRHQCKDKMKCRHVCCKGGVKRRRISRPVVVKHQAHVANWIKTYKLSPNREYSSSLGSETILPASYGVSPQKAFWEYVKNLRGS
jgi:hypothetical protein